MNQTPGGGHRSDDRVEQLLQIFSELEIHERTMSLDQFSELLRQAALACGFADPAEACELLIGPALFKLQRKIGRGCHDKNGGQLPNSSPATS